MIMEAEESRDLPSASCRSRSVTGVIQSHLSSKVLRTRETDSLNSSSRAGEVQMRCLGSRSEGEKRGGFLLCLPFVGPRPSLDWGTSSVSLSPLMQRHIDVTFTWTSGLVFFQVIWIELPSKFPNFKLTSAQQ